MFVSLWVLIPLVILAICGVIGLRVLFSRPPRIDDYE
jgi:hypothetical protein